MTRQDGLKEYPFLQVETRLHSLDMIVASLLCTQVRRTNLLGLC